jgi:hypothetical protein
MSNIMRICPQCGHGNDMDAQYCAQCGYDTQANLPVPQSRNLPAVLGKAAVPVLVGAASLAISAGWKLMQGMLARPAPQPPIQVKKGEVDQARPRATIRIRTSWAMGDSTGKWQRGQSEHTIEIDD